MQDPNTFKLLTPGPLTTSLSVRQQMLVDRCTWDEDYKRITQDIRQGLLTLAHTNPEKYTTVLMQGSGTFGVESVLSSIPSQNDKVLVLVNGAYSERMCQILTYHKINFDRLDFAWDEMPCADCVNAYLNQHPEITIVTMVHNETTSGLLNDIESISRVAKEHDCTMIVDAVNAYLNQHPEITIVTMVHNETTSGLLNDIESISRVAKEHDCTMIVDAMSSFGAVDINVEDLGIDFLISSANKCIQGVPGFSFVIANTDVLTASAGNARSLSLDLYDQWRVMEKDGGKWRFTSPTHVVAAFHQALQELLKEGGVVARGLRYSKCNQMMREGMEQLGFKAFIEQDHQGPIITTFFYPDNIRIEFKQMYAYLKKNGFVIYPGKLTERETFRLGNIGEIYEEDVKEVLSLFASFLKECEHA